MPLELSRGIIIAALSANIYPCVEKRMQIVCATPQAAAQVLSILYAARLQAVRDFTIQPIFSTTPPLIFTMLVALTPVQMAKIRAVADTTIRE